MVREYSTERRMAAFYNGRQWQQTMANFPLKRLTISAKYAQWRSDLNFICWHVNSTTTTSIQLASEGFWNILGSNNLKT